MLEVSGRMMTSHSDPVGKPQGLIITHQDTPIWRWFGEKKQEVVTI